MQVWFQSIRHDLHTMSYIYQHRNVHSCLDCCSQGLAIKSPQPQPNAGPASYLFSPHDHHGLPHVLDGFAPPVAKRLGPASSPQAAGRFLVETWDAEVAASSPACDTACVSGARGELHPQGDEAKAGPWRTAPHRVTRPCCIFSASSGRTRRQSCSEGTC